MVRPSLLSNFIPWQFKGYARNNHFMHFKVTIHDGQLVNVHLQQIQVVEDRFLQQHEVHCYLQHAWPREWG